MDKLQQLAKLKSCRWPMYIVIALCYMFTPFHRMAPAIMGPQLLKDLSLNAVDFGLLGMTFMWAFALAQAPMGSVLDRFGARKGMTIVLLFTAVGSLTFSFAQTFSLVIIGRIIIAIALAGFLIGGAKIISAWFSKKEYPGMWALFMALGTIGGIGATKPLQAMMASYGWRTSFAIIGGASVLLAIAAYILLKDRPSEAGLSTPDELMGEAPTQTQTQATNVDWWQSLKEVLSMPKMWMCGLLALGVNSSGQVLVSLWGGVFLADVYKLPGPVIGDILFASALGLVVGCIAAGWLMKQIKITGVLISGTVVFLCTWLYMTIYLRSLSIFELKVILASMGFVQMYVIVTNFTLIKELVKASQLGTAMGVVNGFTWIFGAGLFQQIWGFIINSISRGVKPYPVEAFQTCMWVQLGTLVVSVMCALYFAKALKQPASGSVSVSK